MNTLLERCARWLLLPLAAACGPAAAFEPWEHERMGNVAYHLAKRLHCQGADAATRQARKPLCDQLDVMFQDPLDEGRVLNPAAFGYGTVARCVDFFLTPEKLLAGQDDRLIFSTETARQRAAGGPQVAVPTSPAEFLGLDLRRHCVDRWNNFSANQAAHSNHTHFQAELVTSQHLYHRLALDAARSGKPFGALFINALSDHYLQDFFAPGHIVTFRSHMSDIYANAVHDSLNHKGAWMRFAPEDLQALLAGLRSEAAGVALSEAVRNYLAQVDGHDKTRDSGDCLRRCEPLPEAQRRALDAAATVADLLDLAAALAQPHEQFPAPHRQGVLLRGDFELWRASQWPQRLLLLALQMRSILDVLQAMDADAAGLNSFLQPSWKSERTGLGQRARIQASLDGRFFYDFMLLGREEFPFLPYVSRDPIEGVDGVHDVVEIASIDGSRVWLRPEGRREFVLSTGLNYEVPRFGRQQWRQSVSLETPVAGFVNTGYFKTSVGMAAGVFFTHEDDRSGWGLSLRPAVVFSQSETFVSVPLRWLRFRRPDGSGATHAAWGLRVDQGFSSFITVYLQGGRAPFRQEAGEVRTGSAYGAGIVLAAPFCRIPGLGRMCYW